MVDATTATGESEGRPSDRFERLEEMAPSAKLVFFELGQASEPLDHGELSERTLLPKRTVRYALNRLREADLVEERPLLTDARKNLYVPHSIERPE